MANIYCRDKRVQVRPKLKEHSKTASRMDPLKQHSKMVVCIKENLKMENQSKQNLKALLAKRLLEYTKKAEHFHPKS